MNLYLKIKKNTVVFFKKNFLVKKINLIKIKLIKK